MTKYEAIAEKLVWGVAVIFVTVFLLRATVGLVDKYKPEWLKRDPKPERQPERVVDMPHLENIKLVLGRVEVRNPGDRVKSALRECVGSPPALISVGSQSRIDTFLADATEEDFFFFYCSSRKAWEMLAGRAGYVKIRNGKPVDELILYMN